MLAPMNGILATLLLISVSSFSPHINTITGPKATNVCPHLLSNLSSTTTTEQTSNESRTELKENQNNQATYGVSAEFPNTYVRCGRCKAVYAMTVDDIGEGTRLACSTCPHSWYQNKDRIFDLNPDHEFTPLPRSDELRIKKNIEAGRNPGYLGDLKFYVGNLDFKVTEDDLLEVFSEAGDVGGVSLALGDDGRSRGFAFVTMMDKSSEESCMALDGKAIKGREVKVNLSTNY